MFPLDPLVSVITPAYRATDTLATTLNSLISQSDWRWESIVVDDGCPEQSGQIVKTYQRDRRFRLLNQHNAGACAARNAGLAVARGKYVLFLDADDSLEPEALATLVRRCEKRRCWAVAGGFRFARPDGSLTEWTGVYDGSTPLFDALCNSNVLSLPSCVMIRRALLDEIGGGFDTSLAHCGDWDLWGRVARCDRRFEFVNECVTGYRMRPASLSRSPLTLLRDARTVLTRLHDADPRVQRPQRRHALGASPEQFGQRVAGFTLYAAVFAAMQGNRPAHREAMETLPQWPTLSPRRIAEFLLHAACLARCVCPDELHPLPREVIQTMQHVVDDLARRVSAADLSAAVEAQLQELGFSCHADVDRTTTRQRLARPRTAGDTLASEYLRSLALAECAA